MSPLIVPVSKLVEEAKKNIDLIYPFLARKRITDENTFFVDIRDIRELWREGKLENAFHAPRGMIEFWVDPSSPYYKRFFKPENNFILYCATGWRSALATNTMKKMGYKNVLSLEGGFKQWKKCMLPTVSVERD
ncbi:MAG: hypothetical protein CBC01_07170 [Betaproteobacteria bacterium TMED41]|nr:MAG: hypothetical protein CBC01_07170 [Betaproteobacteria bacterium TMED41]